MVPGFLLWCLFVSFGFFVCVLVNGAFFVVMNEDLRNPPSQSSRVNDMTTHQLQNEFIFSPLVFHLDGG